MESNLHMISGINSRMKFYYTYKYRDFFIKNYTVARIYTEKLRDYIFIEDFINMKKKEETILIYIYIYIYIYI